MDEILHQVWIATEAAAIKTVKTALEQADIYDKASGVQNIDFNTGDRFTALDRGASLSQYHSLIPTTLRINLEAQNGDISFDELHDATPFFSTTKIKHALFMAYQGTLSRAKDHRSINPIAKVIQEWLQQLDKYSQIEIEDTIRSESWSYQIYPPMLLLSPKTFTSDAWQKMIAEDANPKILSKLYGMMCSATKCTHIAINAAIPIDMEVDSSMEDSQINILRSPLRLVPIHGDFGSHKDTASHDAFQKAFWASALQNGIHQIFAPVHTMFSRGNVKEKARILRLAQQETKPYTAVDLYSGIGYFAFSYVKGGAAVVLGWEINDWSVEGFQRGAKKNHWDVKVIGDNVSDTKSLQSWLGTHNGNVSSLPKLIIFPESNEAAPQRVQSLRDTIPPIKHVNCGYLPSSRQSWHLAMQCLDATQGGCIHVHENVGIADIASRCSEIQSTFEGLLEMHIHNSSLTVLCNRVERVKSYAPGVWHCVFDIEVRQRKDNGNRDNFL